LLNNICKETYTLILNAFGFIIKQAQNCTDEFLKKVKLAREMANEDIILSYVKVEKIKRKLFALTMDVAEVSDISL